MTLITAVAPAVERKVVFTKPVSIHALGIGQIVSWGTLYYSFPLIAENMSRELSISKSEIYGAATTALLASALFAYPVGKLIDQGRGRSVIVTGSLLAGLLMAAWSQASTITLFYMIAFLLGVAQSMTLYDAAFAIIANRSVVNLSYSITRLTLWGGFASTVFVPLTEILIGNFGWRTSLLALGVFNFAAAGLYYRTLPQTPDTPFHLQEKSGRVEGLSIQQQSVSNVLKSQVFWALLFAFTLYSLIFSGLSFHIYPLFSERGLSTSTIAAGMMLLGPAQVFGRLVLSKAISVSGSVSKIGLYVFVAFPVSVLAIISLNPMWALFSFTVIYGVANGITTIIRGTAVHEMLGGKSYGEINSFLTIPSTIFKALGPFVLAWFTQQFGSYDPALIGIFCVTIVILLSFLFAAARQ